MCPMSGREAAGGVFREFSDAMEVKVKDSASSLTVTRPHRSYGHAGGEVSFRYRPSVDTRCNSYEAWAIGVL
jgi:hypothetical protein